MLCFHDFYIKCDHKTINISNECNLLGNCLVIWGMIIVNDATMDKK